jgi:hypothetical protein
MISPESLGIVARERGLPVMPMVGCRKMLERGAQSSGFTSLLHHHYACASRAVDDAASLSWLSDLRVVALSYERGRWAGGPRVIECPELLSLLKHLEQPAVVPQDYPASPDNTSTARISRRAESERTRPAGHQTVHAYGAKAALAWDLDETRGGHKTVSIEAAAAIGPQQYAWDDKIIFQLTVRQLPLVLATLMRWRQLTEFKRHGDHMDKELLLRVDGHKVVVFLAQAQQARAVAIDALDLLSVASLCMKALHANHPHLSQDALLTMVKALAGDQP